MPATIVRTQTQLTYAAIIAVLLIVAGVLIDGPRLDYAGVWGEIAVFGLSVWFGSFVVLRAYAIVRHHRHEGWRRLLVVAGAVGAVIGLYVMAKMNPYDFRTFDLETIVLAATGVLLGFGGAITVSTEAVRLTKWIADGFTKKT